MSQVFRFRLRIKRKSKLVLIKLWLNQKNKFWYYEKWIIFISNFNFRNDDFKRISLIK